MSESYKQMMARFERVERDADAFMYGDAVSVEAMRGIYAMYRDAYCGEFSDGEGSREGFKWCCQERMKEAGVKPSPRAWVEAAMAIVPRSYVFGPY
jgi:hypothetical protein